MRLVTAAMAIAAAGCFPSFDEQVWLIEAPRLLAVAAAPAEAKPSEAVQLTALAVSPRGPLATTGATWAFCLQPRELEERNAVSAVCLEAGTDVLQPIAPTSALLPFNACSLFGPNPPPSEPGQPPLRPADPDVTGGYYVPVRFELAPEEVLGFGFARVRCDLAGATREVFEEFTASYTNNLAPVISGVEAEGESGAVVDAQAMTTIPRGSTWRLRLRWDPASNEPYPVYDTQTLSLVDHVEAMSAAWYTTAGELRRSRTEAAEEETQAGTTSLGNTFVAPEEAGPVWLWIVLRDARGGVTWVQLSWQVQ